VAGAACGGFAPAPPGFSALVPLPIGTFCEQIAKGGCRGIPLDRSRPLSWRSGCLPAWPYPPLSPSLFANSGSLLTLKLVTRCGFRPCVRQMRPTLDSEMPASRAMMLRDQCVAFTGLLCVVFSIIWLTVWVEMDGVRPGLLASLRSPSTPSARKRSRHRATIRGATSIRSAICLF